MGFRINNRIKIPVENARLTGDLFIPENARAVVIFSHGSGSSRLSPRNQEVAKHLRDHGLGTLLFDLLMEEEDLNYHNRFNIDLLTERLIAVTKWLEKQPVAKDLWFGFFGASTGAASALKAASRLPNIGAVVSRGGRPDLVMGDLPKVKAPVLLLVGSLDEDVLHLNKMAYEKLNCTKKLEVISGASHLFEERGMLEKVADQATKWFLHYLQPVEQ